MNYRINFLLLKYLVNEFSVTDIPLIESGFRMNSFFIAGFQIIYDYHIFAFVN
ncbi:hypothetical protein D3C81_2332290 [compost metagenome]